VRLAAHRRKVRGPHLPLHRVKNATARMEHEASTSKIGEDQIFYCNQRGISKEDAVSLIVGGFCKQVFRELAHGVRRRGSEALEREPRRQRRITVSDYFANGREGHHA